MSPELFIGLFAALMVAGLVGGLTASKGTVAFCCCLIACASTLAVAVTIDNIRFNENNQIVQLTYFAAFALSVVLCGVTYAAWRRNDRAQTEQYRLFANAVAPVEPTLPLEPTVVGNQLTRLQNGAQRAADTPRPAEQTERLDTLTTYESSLRSHRVTPPTTVMAMVALRGQTGPHRRLTSWHPNLN